MKKYLYFSFILFFAGCSSKTKDNYYHSKFVPGYELIQVDSLNFINSDTLFISQTGDMEVWRNFILISDFNFMKVWIFDKKLNLIRTLGRKGRGPGEYVNAPVILSNNNKNTLFLLNMKFRTVNLYDTLFNFIKSIKLPSEIEFPPYSPVAINNGYVFWISYPYPISDVRYYTKYKSLAFLNKKFEHVKDFLPWDKIFLKGGGYTLNNFMVLLCGGNKNSFFAMQRAALKINHISQNLKTMKVFGIKPKYFKKPPDVKFMDTQKSVEAAVDFASKTTRILKMCYDKKNKYLLVNYTNLDEGFFYAKTLLFGKHYLQIYNQDYDCIFDGPIPGKLAFAMDGKIYVLTDEKPEFIKFKLFKLVKKDY